MPADPGPLPGSAEGAAAGSTTPPGPTGGLPAGLPGPVAEYLATVPAERAPALLALRADILDAVPEPYEERFSYGIITVNHQGGVVGYGATDKHCALYVMDPPLVARLRPELGAFAASGGTIRFQPEGPLPTELVHRIVAERVATNLTRAEQRAAARRARASRPSR